MRQDQNGDRIKKRTIEMSESPEEFEGKRGLALRKKAVGGSVSEGPMLGRMPPDDEGPSPEDLERFGGVTQTCPSCGKDLYDDADVCWDCGHVLMAKTGKPIPTWAYVIGVIAVAAMLLAIV